MSQCLRRTQPVFAKSRCTAFFINQIREKMVMMGNPETTPGGRALRFYSSIRLEVRPCAYLNDKGAEVKTKEEAAGHRIKVKVVKNKIFPPFKTAEFDFYYGVGVDLETDIVSVAKSLGVIETSGTWLSYGSCKEQGAAKMKAALRDANLFEEIKQKTMELVGFAKCSGE
jgi:recombination protein RecA